MQNKLLILLALWYTYYILLIKYIIYFYIKWLFYQFNLKNGL